MAQNNTPTVEQLIAMNQTLLAKIQELEARKGKGNLSLKLGPSGTVCVYGLQAKPVSLYEGQWDRILTPEFAKMYQDFKVEHRAILDGVKADHEQSKGVKAAAGAVKAEIPAGKLDYATWKANYGKK